MNHIDSNVEFLIDVLLIDYTSIHTVYPKLHCHM